MKKLLERLDNIFANAAFWEMGTALETLPSRPEQYHETIEDNLVEVAFAEAADFDAIHNEILLQHANRMDNVHPDDCQYGDNDICYA